MEGYCLYTSFPSVISSFVSSLQLVRIQAGILMLRVQQPTDVERCLKRNAYCRFDPNHYRIRSFGCTVSLVPNGLLKNVKVRMAGTCQTIQQFGMGYWYFLSKGIKGVHSKGLKTLVVVSFDYEGWPIRTLLTSNI